MTVNQRIYPNKQDTIKNVPDNPNNKIYSKNKIAAIIPMANSGGYTSFNKNPINKTKDEQIWAIIHFSNHIISN